MSRRPAGNPPGRPRAAGKARHHFAAILESRMQSLGIDRATAAQRTRRSLSTIADWCTGRRRPVDPETILDLLARPR